MELSAPIDAALRARLKAAKPNQEQFGKAIGRSKGWVNKYMNGAGNATIDDAVRIAALLIGVETEPLSEWDRRALKVLRAAPKDRREDLVAVMETAARGYRRGQHPESNEPADGTPQATKSRARGTR